MKKTSFLLLFLLSATVVLNAQKIKLVKGDLSALKGESAVNVNFIYDDMAVGRMTEKEYITKKVDEYNINELGRGETWAMAWENDRERLYHPKFTELFNKYAKMVILPKAQKYTLIFHTTFTEPGFNVGVARSNAYIHATMYLVETENPENILAEISIINAPGRDAMGYDFAVGPRVAEAYAISGKKLGAFIAKANK